MVSKLKTTEKTVIHTLLNMTIKNHQSPTGGNVLGVLRGSNRDNVSDLDPSLVEEMPFHPQDQDVVWAADTVENYGKIFLFDIFCLLIVF